MDAMAGSAKRALPAALNTEQVQSVAKIGCYDAPAASLTHERIHAFGYRIVEEGNLPLDFA